MLGSVSEVSLVIILFRVVVVRDEVAVTADLRLDLTSDGLYDTCQGL